MKITRKIKTEGAISEVGCVERREKESWAMNRTGAQVGSKDLIWVVDLINGPC